MKSCVIGRITGRSPIKRRILRLQWSHQLHPNSCLVSPKGAGRFMAVTLRGIRGSVRLTPAILSVPPLSPPPWRRRRKRRPLTAIGLKLCVG